MLISYFKIALRPAIQGSTFLLAAAGVAHGADAASASDALMLKYAAITDNIYVDGTFRPIDAISATKAPTPLIDTPQSISVISGLQIEEQAFVEFSDILRYTPGASTGQGEGHRDQFTIRGQNTTADFFVDGLRDDVQYFRPLYNLERVEILRGSNALLFGRGGGGGVVNRVTKKPSTDGDFASGMASVDTFGSALLEGDVNYALSAGAAVRVNAYYEELANHRDFFDGDRYAVNPTFSTKIGASTELQLSYEYVRDERVVDRGVPSLNGEPLRGRDNVFFGDPDQNQAALTAHIARGRIDHRISEGFTANATIQFADYEKIYQNVFPIGFDATLNEVTFDGYRDPTERQNLIFQANLLGEFSTGPLGHTLLAGIEYGDQSTVNSRQDAVFAATNDDIVTFAFADPLAVPVFSFPADSRSRSSEAAFLSFYLQDQIDLGPVQLVAGIRYDRFEIDVVDTLEVEDGAGDGNDGLLGRTDEEWSPRLGLIYKPVSDLSVYASYSRSFLPRSGEQFLGLDPVTEALAPEKFDNYEVGVKWDATDLISLTAAVFRLDRENGTTVDPTDPGNVLIIGSRTEGFEAQVVGEATPWWTVSAGYSYLDASQRGNVSGGVVVNQELAQVPEHMFSIWNRIEATDRLSFGLGVTHQSSQFASISNAVELPSFARLDAAIYYRVTDGVRVQVNLENALDTDYFPAAHNDDNISTGEPINARFSITGTL
ncbi:MAG: TonB-dependent siderophore receptor [Alphaproteobacteria bacterium]|nr:TonB-dependent siderophore receptor [Alphaproteobacteria bacterium]